MTAVHERNSENKTESLDGFRFSPRPNRANDIEWRHWGDAAFREAQDEGKLVLLSISAVWCHWCHVMDETTYSDRGVIERINREFIPVRVDSDKRPDINKRYNQGGWPTTAFLLPSGRVIAGLTYTPPAQMRTLLDRISVTYRHRKHDIQVEAASVAASERAAVESLLQKGGLDRGIVDDVVEAIVEQWDRENGGVGVSPKFPPFGALRLALALHHYGGFPELDDFAFSSLDAMKNGGLFDSVEGGFFRYATASDWSAPHYEKMLADNARLVSLYLAAAGTMERPDYSETARRTLDFMLERLLDQEQRGFYGSQDADEDYYLLDEEGRSEAGAPAVDPTIYVDSTSEAVSALTRASFSLDDPVLLAMAVRITDFIWRDGYRHGTGVCHYFTTPEGEAAHWGEPSDQVYLLQALIDVYEAELDNKFLQRAVELGDLFIGKYMSPAGLPCEFTESADEPTAAAAVLEDMPPDLPDISLVGDAALALVRLEALSPGRGYGEAAERMLQAMARRYGSYSHFAAPYALAVLLATEGLVEIRIGENTDGDLAREIFAAAAGRYDPRVLVRPETIDDYIAVDEKSDAPPATVCTPGSCRPAYSRKELEDLLTSVESSTGGDGD